MKILINTILIMTNILWKSVRMCCDTTNFETESFDEPVAYVQYTSIIK